MADCVECTKSNFCKRCTASFKVKSDNTGCTSGSCNSDECVNTFTANDWKGVSQTYVECRKCNSFMKNCV